MPTISIEETAAGLQQYVNRFGNQIHSKLRQELEFERDLPFVDTDYAYTGQDGEVSDLLQPYQSQFTPKGDESFDGITSYIRPVKVDKKFDDAQIQKFFSRWKSKWFTPDPEQKRIGYAQYVLEKLIGPKISEEINSVSWSGQYAAPTPGTPGAVLESVDGFKVGLADQINAGRLTPLNTGVIDTANIVEQVREFCNSIPEPYRYRMGSIYMSKTNAQAYADDYQTQYPHRKVTTDEPDRLYLRVDHYNKTIKGFTSMEGSDRFIVVFDNDMSMIVGERTGYSRYFRWRFEAEDRNLKVFGEIYRFYSFETCKHMFVNDQV